MERQTHGNLEIGAFHYCVFTKRNCHVKGYCMHPDPFLLRQFFVKVTYGGYFRVSPFHTAHDFALRGYITVYERRLLLFSIRKAITKRLICKGRIKPAQVSIIAENKKLCCPCTLCIILVNTLSLCVLFN
jgi:hypothetical protein